MNKILKETIKKENIDLLKVRDYFFDKARILNYIRLVFSLIPVALLLISYISYIPSFEIIDKYRDLIIGGISIFFIVINILINNSIQDYLYIQCI